MEIFFSKDIVGGKVCRLDETESHHCIKVLRHTSGDEISVIDGQGTLMRCRIRAASSKSVEAEIVESIASWGAHPYRLCLAVCPTKNIDRYEWFAEKACEVGVDNIVPIIGEHSERRILHCDRIRKILVSASKQSLKGRIPEVSEPVTVEEFIAQCPQEEPSAGGPLKLIAYCFEDETRPRISIKEALLKSDCRDVIIMIGPEGDFSAGEAALAVDAGFIPVHLGPSRLRTETAAVTAAEAVYFKYM